MRVPCLVRNMRMRSEDLFGFQSEECKGGWFEIEKRSRTGEGIRGFVQLDNFTSRHVSTSSGSCGFGGAIDRGVSD